MICARRAPLVRLKMGGRAPLAVLAVRTRPLSQTICAVSVAKAMLATTAPQHQQVQASTVDTGGAGSDQLVVLEAASAQEVVTATRKNTRRMKERR